MKRIALAAVVLTACGALAGCAAGTGDKVSLKPHYVPGRYTQTVTTEGFAKMKMGERDIDSKTTMVMTLSMTVAAPDADGVKKVTMKFKRIQMNVSSGGETFAVDTDKPAAAGEGPQAKMAGTFAKLAGAEITMTIAADERIKDVTGLSKMWDELGKGNPELAQQAAAMKKSLGDDMIKNMIKRSAAAYPDKPVAVGEAWTTELPVPMDLPGLGKTTIKMTNTLKALEDGGKTAVTAVKGKIESQKASDGDNAPPKVKIVMELEGTMRLNAENSLLTGGELNIKGTVEVGNGMTSDITTRVITKSERE